MVLKEKKIKEVDSRYSTPYVSYTPSRLDPIHSLSLSTLLLLADSCAEKSSYKSAQSVVNGGCGTRSDPAQLVLPVAEPAGVPSRSGAHPLHPCAAARVSVVGKDGDEPMRDPHALLLLTWWPPAVASSAAH